MNQTFAKGLYVAGVTTFCTFLGCWAVLAHQSGAESSRSAQSTRKMSMADEEFAKKAAQGGMAEVKLGQLAEEKASNEKVKSFAQKMVEDHGKANDKLKEVASKENINLPSDLDSKDEATYESLSKLSGPAFDRAYARDMVKDHQQDIAEFHREATNGRKEPIKSFAQETLPTLQKHLQEARQMEQTVSRSGMGKTHHQSPTTPTQRR